MKQEKLVVIDGNALIHRAFHALPPLSTPDGVLVNAVYGVASIFFKMYRELKPTYVILTLDKDKKTFRHEAYTEYKANRTKQPDELYDQIPLVRELATALGMPIYEQAGYEADDLIGTLVRQAEQEKPHLQNSIVTGDMDALQLVTATTHVFTMKKGLNDTVTYDTAAVHERYGLNPDQIVDYKALRGDASDNIPGVRGIGEKTAVELLQKFGTLEATLAAAERGDKKITDRVRTLLTEHADDARLSQQLARIVTDAPVTLDLSAARVREFDRPALFALFQRLGFKSLLSRLPEVEKAIGTVSQGSLFGDAAAAGEPAAAGGTKSAHGTDTPDAARPLPRPGYTLVTAETASSFLAQLNKQTMVAVDTETTSLDTLEARLLGVGIGWRDGEAYYWPWATFDTQLNNKLAAVLANEKIKKTAHNLKYDLAVFQTNGVELRGATFDSMLADYLLHPGSRSHSLDNLSFVEFGFQKIPTVQLLGTGKQARGMEAVPLPEVADYCCEDVDYTWRLFGKLSDELEQKNLLHLLEKIELPLVPVLATMERNGVHVDVAFLEKLDDQIDRERTKVDAKIFKHAGEEFNIDSPQQLQAILFDKLKISREGVKRGKTGISTAAAELEKLAGRHPIIELVSTHRELAKLQSTYTRALPQLVHPRTGRVHTSFNQAVTATGRLSSSDPNLQNIPIRTELGREIRKSFAAPRGYRIVKADYSQIELRIVASLARDQRMLEIFAAGQDIHRATAAEINGVPLEKVTKEMRYRAKEVNFGVLYGMGAYGLSWRTGITMDEAQDFIAKYFDAFSGVKDYLDETIRLARETGYVETLFGRVRPLPEINSGMAAVRRAAERMAVNAPIQGTAADLMKLAMIAVQAEIEKRYDPADVKLLLQVHDELVLEVKKDLVPDVARHVKQIMETVYTLRVPVVAEVETGPNWGSTKPVAMQE